MSIEPQLNLMEMILPPALEWRSDGRCWTAIRAAEGFGYCLHGGSAQGLKAGDALIISPNLDVSVRASQLGELRLDLFRVETQRLSGLISVVEWRQLERIANQTQPFILFFGAEDPLARKFARLVALPDHESLPVRLALLQLWASCVAEALRPSEDTTARRRNLKALFRRFISKISEKELATSTLSEMSSQLNCSERHLSRLFRVEFGMSLREKQTQLSLQHACQLLMDPAAKIRSVAYDTGYRHVGFFNTLFKKRFGVTPKEWRQKNLTRGSQALMATTVSGTPAVRPDENGASAEATAAAPPADQEFPTDRIPTLDPREGVPHGTGAVTRAAAKAALAPRQAGEKQERGSKSAK